MKYKFLSVIDQNNPDYQLFNRLNQICFNLNDNSDYPYSVFVEKLSTNSKFPLFDFLLATNHLKQITFQECIGNSTDNQIRNILGSQFDDRAINKYLDERYFIFKQLHKYLKDFEIYEFKKLPINIDIEWLGIGCNEQGYFTCIIIPLPKYLDYYNSATKPIQSYSSLLLNDEQVQKFHNILSYDKFEIISLSWNIYHNSITNKKSKFLDTITSYIMSCNKVPNDIELLKMDNIERNKISTIIEYISDEEGYEIEQEVEVSENDGYSIEIYGVEYQVVLIDVVEEKRLHEIKRQIYSHIYYFNELLENIWTHTEPYLEYLKQLNQSDNNLLLKKKN